MSRENVRLVDVNVGVTQRHQRRGVCAAGGARRACAGMKCTRVLLQQLARLFRAHPAALLHDALLELEQVSHRVGHVFPPMRGEHPGHRRARGAVQPRQEARVVARIEPVGHFIEQQQFRPAGERAGDEHQPPLAIRKREETPFRERTDLQPAQQRADAACLRPRVSSRIGMSVRCTPVPTTSRTRKFHS